MGYKWVKIRSVVLKIILLIDFITNLKRGINNAVAKINNRLFCDVADDTKTLSLRGIRYIVLRSVKH